MPGVYGPTVTVGGMSGPAGGTQGHGGSPAPMAPRPSTGVGIKFGTHFKKGGKCQKMAKGGSVKSSASKRADGCASKGKTKGKMV